MNSRVIKSNAGIKAPPSITLAWCISILAAWMLSSPFPDCLPIVSFPLRFSYNQSAIILCVILLLTASPASLRACIVCVMFLRAVFEVWKGLFPQFTAQYFTIRTVALHALCFHLAVVSIIESHRSIVFLTLFLACFHFATEYSVLSHFPSFSTSVCDSHDYVAAISHKFFWRAARDCALYCICCLDNVWLKTYLCS